MWKNLAKFVLRFKWLLLALLLVTTVFMGYQASKVKLSYEFSKAIPSDNVHYTDYLSFKEKFGDDGNLLVVGIQTDSLFQINNFLAYKKMMDSLRALPNVEDILSIPGAITLYKNDFEGKMEAVRIFSDSIATQEELNTSKEVFFNLPFYKNLLYNRATNAYLMGVRLNKEILNSPLRTEVVGKIVKVVDKFSKATGLQTHLSGLPLIRTLVAEKVKKEMKLFLFGSLLFSVLILLLFFRSLSNMLLSLAVVAIGVIWSVGAIQLFGYQITLLTALIPSLVVVIGIPNCIYFLNKYHTSYLSNGDKQQSLIEMVSKMGVVTLFCNITAAIGFAVFAFTKSDILREFGLVAGLGIMFIFVISFILLPAIMSLLPVPKPRELKYLQSNWINNLLQKIEYLVFEKPKMILAITGITLLIAIVGIFRLQSVAHILDDLPKTDVIYKDLKFFEQNFKGVMPLEVIIDTKKPKGILQTSIDIKAIARFEDSVLAMLPDIGKPLSVIDGIKFTYQAISQGTGDSTYTLPAFGNPMADLHKSLRKLQLKKEAGTMDKNDTAMLKLVGSFIDSSEQYLRISMSMGDVGTKRLPIILDSIQKQADRIFDSSYKVTLTGSSITFLEGSKYIVNGLKESIFWAFLLISICMIYLFRDLRIVLCSLLPNIVPLVITAGIMGWVGIPIKPSTVLVFSVALGIAVDITIRFLVNYKQVLAADATNKEAAIRTTIKQTGLSIIYTSLVLMAGFIIFCASSFGGTFALGWLTSLTLLTGTATNLVLLPVLLNYLGNRKDKGKIKIEDPAGRE